MNPAMISARNSFRISLECWGVVPQQPQSIDQQERMLKKAQLMKNSGFHMSPEIIEKNNRLNKEFSYKIHQKRSKSKELEKSIQNGKLLF